MESKDQKFHAIKLIGLIIDPVSKSPVIILKIIGQKKVLPIWIGESEANIITMELEKISAPRPMTHDLIVNLMDELPGELREITIDTMRENSYHATLRFDVKGSLRKVDCRPSDAVIISLKKKVPMRIRDKIVSLSTLSDFFTKYLYDRERLDEWFDSIQCEDGDGFAGA